MEREFQNLEDDIYHVSKTIKELKKAKTLKTVKEDGEKISVVNKLIKNKKNTNTNIENSIPNIKNITSAIYKNKNNAEDILRLFPDLDLSIQILVSSIISPKDMVNNDLIFNSSINIITPEVLNSLLNTLKKYIEKEYKIISKLTDIIRKSLFEDGSYITAVIPENVIDELINIDSDVYYTEPEALDIDTSKVKPDYKISLESFESNVLLYNKPKGFLGFEDNISLESSETVNNLKLNENFNIQVLDSFEILAAPKIKKLLRKLEVNKRLGIRNDVIKDKNDIQINRLYKRIVKKRNIIDIPNVNELKRDPITKPLVMKLPSESVIPIFMPNDPSNHVGYFIVLDENGNPINYNKNYVEKQNIILDYVTKKPNENTSANKLKKQLYGNTNRKINPELLEQFKDIIEKDLIDKLKKGLYDKTLKIGDVTPLYSIMLSRSLEQKQTKLLFMPSELISYVAYKYYNNGVGKSLLDDLNILTSIRAMLMFSKLMATIKNSIAITNVNLKLDEHDPDPEATIEKAIAQVMSTRQSFLPVGVNNPVDLVDWLHRSGIQFTFDSHPAIPDVRLDFDTKSLDHKVPEEDIEDNIRKQIIMSLGLNPEIVDNSFSPDFATTIVENNILFSKRIAQFQEVYSKELTDLIYKLTINDGEILNELKDIIKNDISNIKKFIRKNTDIKIKNNLSKEELIDFILEEFLNNLNIKFPSPDITNIKNLYDSFSNYKTALEDAIDSVLSEEALPSELAGDISDNIDILKDVIKHFYLRKWMSENNFLPELSEILNITSDGKPGLNLYDYVKSYIEGLSINTFDLLKILNKTKSKINEKLDKLDEEEDEDEELDNEDNDNIDNDNTDNDELNNNTDNENIDKEDTDNEDNVDNDELDNNDNNDFLI